MKKKLFTKLGIAALGLAMAVVTGAAIQNATTETKAADTKITFTLGADGDVSHSDGSSASTTYSETVDGYTLNISNGSKMYPKSRDAKGNGCLKFGTGSAAGSMSFTAPQDISSVILEVGKYKSNTTKISVNGTAYTLTKNSNDGAYDEITVDTSTTKTVNFTTNSGGYRAMLNSIIFVKSESSSEPSTPETPVTYTVRYDANGGTGTMDETTMEAGEYTLLDCTFDAPSGKEFSGWKANNEGDLLKEGSKYPISANVTFYAQWEDTETPEPEQPDTPSSNMVTWELTDINSISASDVVVVTATKGNTTWALANNNGTGSAPTAVEVSVSGNTLTSDVTDTIKWNIANSSGNITFYPNGSTATWLYCTASNNGVRVGTNTNKNFTVDSSSGYFKNTATSRYLGVYTINPDWRCYTSTTGNIAGQTFAIYKQTIIESDPESVLKSITITNNNNGFKTQYNSNESWEDPNINLVVTGTYTDGNKEIPSSYITWEFNPKTPAEVIDGTVVITATYILNPEIKDDITIENIQVTPVIAPIIENEINNENYTWTATNYAGSPHTLTYNEKYDFVLSAGQFNSSKSYLGTNDKNPTVTEVTGDKWTLKGTSLEVVDGLTWLTHGQAFYMSNFGIYKPTEFTITAGGENYDSGSYYILSSVDSGDSWNVLTNGELGNTTQFSWTGDNYKEEEATVQFALVTTCIKVGTLNTLSLKVVGESLKTTKALQELTIEGTPKTTYYVGESFDLLDAKIYANYTDSVTYPKEDVSELVSWSEITKDTSTVTGTYLGKTIEIAITVNKQGLSYKKILSNSELFNGSKVVIANNAQTALMGPQKANNRDAVTAEALKTYSAGGILTHSINTEQFIIETVIEGETTFYLFKDSKNNYLYAPNTDENYLRSTQNIEEASKWSIVFEDGFTYISTSVEIEGVATTKYMGGSAQAFGTYLSRDNNKISLYVDLKTNTQYYVEQFMHMNDTNYEGQGTGLCQSAGTYLAAKTALNNLGQDYITEFSTNAEFADAYQRYMAWATANGDTQPFTGSEIVKSSMNLLDNLSNGNSNMTIIIITSAITVLSTFFLYTFARKAKKA